MLKPLEALNVSVSCMMYKGNAFSLHLSMQCLSYCFSYAAPLLFFFSLSKQNSNLFLHYKVKSLI